MLWILDILVDLLIMVSISSVDDEKSLKDKQDKVFVPTKVPTKIYTAVPINDPRNNPRSLSDGAAEQDRKLRVDPRKSTRSGTSKGFMKEDSDDMTDVDLTDMVNRMATMENTVNDLKPLKNLIGMEDSIKDMMGELKVM